MAQTRRFPVLLIVLLAAAACSIQVEKDDSCTSTWYADADGDGDGDSASTTEACDQPAGYVANSVDCDDLNADVNPGAKEVCNEFASVDEDCDPETVAPQNSAYADTDGDGYGDPGRENIGCGVSKDFVADNTDCDDTNADANPNATEVTNDIDDDCDGKIDE